MDELSRPTKLSLRVWVWVVLGVVVLLGVAAVLTQFFGRDVTFGLRSQVNAPGFTDEEVAAVPSSEITFVEPDFPVAEDVSVPVAEESVLPAEGDDTSSLPSSASPTPTDVPVQTSDELLQPELPASDPAIQSSAAPEAVVSNEPVVEDNVAIGDFSDKETAAGKGAYFIESALNKVVGTNAYIVRVELVGMKKQEIVCSQWYLDGKALSADSWAGLAPDVSKVPCS